MGNRMRAFVPAVLVALTALGLNLSDAHAKSNYGSEVDQACASFNGTTPFQDQSCALCHTSDLKQRVDPEWAWWENQQLTNFCPQPANQAPNGLINSPGSDRTIGIGDSVVFTGSGSDPDGDLPLSFEWDFGGGAPNSTLEDPGAVVFDSAGTFTITFVVTDSLGLSDPTPPKRTIVVSQSSPTCTDTDGDGFALEGGNCGPVDCNDNDASVNPGAAEDCTDDIDNNCNGLVDSDDPSAQNCPAIDVCLDNDADDFSADGGICGPIDCDDFDASINPNVAEHCGDGIDNDCDGAFDTDDRECNGGDCLAQFVPPPNAPAINITHSDWNTDKLRLRVRGDKARPGALVTVTNSVTGAPVGTATVQDDGKWRMEIFEPAVVPCRVRVEIDGRTGERDVEDAPSNCDGGGGTAPVIDISRAEWKAGDRKLIVEGKGGPGNVMAILRNASTGDLLAAKKSEDDGRWKFEVEKPAVAPCRVRVVIDGRSAERDVANAPSNCDSAGGNSGAIRITHADWDAGKARLRVRGEKAQPGAEVKITDGDTGTLLDTVLVMSDGKWRYEVTLNSPTSVPCRVGVRIGNDSVVTDIEDAPAQRCGP